ncbi:glycosyltransferase WbuB [Paraburkholderia sp. Ac-20340]|uniref:WcaI family glycosyltransferase n=1 Tax=Paraburkholderia sp. Ac-20340 TaxID=2703888 RepID=UPI00197F98D4|nr:glycosyltransferase WbuB [Paraburkholderia sp. Ac-20340]
MKILIYGINYAPEMTGIGKYTGEMATWLAARGHEVRVVTAPPYYPEWQVAEPYSANRYASETRDGVQVVRAPLWVPSKPRGKGRLVHLASFALSSLPLMLRFALWRPDVVFCVAPSLLNAPTGWLAARLCGAHAWLHIQDFEVDAAFKLDILRGSWLKRTALAIERALLTRFDSVSTISGKMLERAADKGVRAAQLVRFPNWASTDAVFPLERVSRLKAALGIAPDAMVVLYSGNMGMKQGLDVLTDATLALKDQPDLAFVFCGSGPARAAIEAACGELPNCRVIDLRPVEELNELLNLADIHVLPQRADAADLVMPSKLTGMFASGRAVIAMASPGTELHSAVAPRGMVVPPGDAPSLAQAIRALADDPVRRAEFGKAGRAFAVASLSRDGVLEDFDARLRAVRAARKGPSKVGTKAESPKTPALEVVRDAERPG